MELRLREGQYVPGAPGGFERVFGKEELLQRVCMKLKARRGEFYPLPEYGSRLYTLASVKPSLRETAARQFILEALADETGLVLDSVEVEEGEDQGLNVRACFTYQEDMRLTVDTSI